jgi:glycosyltransferase involved in cell wall biosynthesis
MLESINLNSRPIGSPHKPIVSVIVPSFNHGRYIQECIDSVLQQTYDNIEIIVCDDGSTDDTSEVLKKYTGHPQVTTLLFSKNRGQSAAIMDGVAKSKGEFIAILPSDDFYLPTNIERKVKKFQESPVGTGVVYSKAARYFESSKRIEVLDLPVHTGKVLEHFMNGPNFVYPVTPLFLRECFNVFDFNLNARAEGEAVYPEISIHFGFEYVDEVLCVMRDHETNTGKQLKGNLADSEARWNIFFSRTDLPAGISKLRRKVFSWLYSIYGMGMMFDMRDTQMGRSLLVKSALNHPLTARSLRNLVIVAASFVPFGLSTITVAQNFKRRLRNRRWPW